MKCFVCNQAETIFSLTSVLLERGHMTLAIHNVPVRLCPHCGEAYAEETVVVNLLHQAEKTLKAGTKVEAREYAQAQD